MKMYMNKLFRHDYRLSISMHVEDKITLSVMSIYSSLELLKTFFDKLFEQFCFTEYDVSRTAKV